MIDKEKVFKAVGYQPHEKQCLYHDSQARFKVCVCGRRFGKSNMAAMDKVPIILDPSKKTRGWIVGPTYNLAEKEFRYIWDTIVVKMGLGPEIKKKAYNVRSGEMYLHMPWGTVIEAKSADHPDGLVGEGLDWVIMAEAAKMPSAIWEKYIRPALADKHGTADFITTPEGYNWIYEIKTAGESDPQWEAFHFPSWENPYVYPGGREDPEIVAIEKTSSSAFFKQEIAAEFTAFAGRIYDEFDPNIHVIDYDYDARVPNFLAIDYGYVNPFVALDVQVTPSDDVYVWREYYKTHEPIHRHAEYLLHRENPAGYHIQFATADAADPGATATLHDYKVAQILTSGDAKPWDQGVHEIKKLLNPANPRLFISRNCPTLISEFNSYRTQDTKKEKQNAKEEPHKFADHGLDALRYFVMHRFVLGAGYHISDMKSVYQQPVVVGASRGNTTSRGFFTLGDRRF